MPHLPILYLLPLPPPPPTTVPRSWSFFCASCLHSPPDSLRVLQWNAQGLRARSTKLLHFLLSHPIDLICIQESNLNSSSSFRIPGFSALRSDRTHSRSGILSSDTTHTSSSIVIFVRQGLFFSELHISALSSLDPYSDYVAINISLNDSCLLSFLNMYAPLFTPPQRMAEPIPSLPPPEIFLFWGTCHHPLWDSRVTSDPHGKKYSTGSSSLTSSTSMTLAHPPFSIAHVAVAPLLTSFLPLFSCPFLLLGGATGPWF